MIFSTSCNKPCTYRISLAAAGKRLMVFLIVLSGCTSSNRISVTPVHTDSLSYAIIKKQEVTNGSVASAHTLASQIGVEMMKRGGNAVDAAIATKLALAVVYPEAGNLGGGGFLVARLANGKNITIDFREKAPEKATRDMYLDTAGNVIENLSTEGHLAAGVPGSVAGIFASMKYARLPFKTLIQPAIDLAEKGFVLTSREARNLNGPRENFLKNNTIVPAFVKSEAWKEGDTLIQKELAETLKRIRDQGMDGFYKGETARLIVEEMARGKGLISLKDLAAYEAVEREPVLFSYRGYEILTMGLPSSGGILLPQMMKMISQYPVADYGFANWQSVQLMTEIERRAYADRAKFLGDIDFYKVPVKKLTSDEYAKMRMMDYDPSKAGTSIEIGPGIISESEETTHLSTCDREGNAVSLTTTLNGGYGSYTVVGGAGFLLNNEMDDFSSKPGVPNMYGAVGAEANAIVPGKRMLSSMTPTIVLKNKKPYIVVGTPGGTTITTSVFQTLINLLEFGMSPEDAVNKPKFHHQWLPDNIQVERDFPAETRKKLESVGYRIVDRNSIGRVELIVIDDSGKMTAIADKRGEDSAAGY